MASLHYMRMRSPAPTPLPNKDPPPMRALHPQLKLRGKWDIAKMFALVCAILLMFTLAAVEDLEDITGIARRAIHALPRDAMGQGNEVGTLGIVDYEEIVSRRLDALPEYDLPELHLRVLPTHPELSKCMHANDSSTGARAIGAWDFMAWKLFENLEAARPTNNDNVDFQFMYFNHYDTLRDACLVENGTRFTQAGLVHRYAVGKASEQPKPYRLVVPMSHDFGRCFFYYPKDAVRVENTYQKTEDLHFLQKAIVVSPYGDTDTGCFDSRLDIVVPPFSPATRFTLLPFFEDAANVAPTDSREYLFCLVATKQFDNRAPGLREKLIEHSWSNLDDLFIPQRGSSLRRLQGGGYAQMLNSSQFCLVPPGTVGWSPRLFDAIYAGCIPVIIAQNTVFPFETEIDYSKFSVRIPTDEAARDPSVIERKLRALGSGAKRRMQEEALRVRDAFVWKADGSYVGDGPREFLMRELRRRKLSLQREGLWNGTE
mmetsp:Transcript_23703/g.57875  ORF Transcript_23703/g.57875 Transcript_23703/m.57875 type:complete len:486 (-) Transcript_23703:145-1602(-)